MFRQILIAGVILISCAAWGTELPTPYVDVIPTPGFIVVGSIPDGCAHVLDSDGKPARTPQGFRLSPDDALKRAVKEHGLRCASEPHVVTRGMSANIQKYYYSILIFWTSHDKTEMYAVHVDGRSGKVEVIGDDTK